MDTTGETCIHFWTIDTPNGPGGSRGICKLCGESKMFSNTPIFSEFLSPRRRGLIGRKDDVVYDNFSGETLGDSETGTGNWIDARG